MIKKQLYFLFICFLSIGLNAQTITLKGTVENSLQQPLTYANVIAKPTDSLKALKFERRLEFGMEGPRFFDLVRWGEAATVLNGYLAVEKTKRDFLANAKFTAGRDEYYPIPQREIDFTAGLYKQNPGY